MNQSISKRGRGGAGIVGYVLFNNPIRAFDPLWTILATKAILETAATRKTEKSTTYGDFVLTRRTRHAMPQSNYKNVCIEKLCLIKFNQLHQFFSFSYTFLFNSALASQMAWLGTYFSTYIFPNCYAAAPGIEPMSLESSKVAPWPGTLEDDLPTELPRRSISLINHATS